MFEITISDATTNRKPEKFDAEAYSDQLLENQADVLKYCRQRWSESSGASANALETLIDDQNITLVINHAASVLLRGDVPEFDESDVLGIVKGATAHGVSASLIISWLRTLEQAILDYTLNLADDSAIAKDEIFRRISLFFNALYDFQLRHYEAIQHEIGSWHSNVSQELINYILSATVPDAKVIKSQAYALGIDPDVPYRAVALKITQPIGQYERNRLKYRLDALFKELSTQGMYLAQEKGDVIIGLISPKYDNDELLQKLRSFLDDSSKQRYITFSTGEPASNLSRAAHSCRQALSTLQVACFRSRTGKITQCRDVILEVLLSHNIWVSNRIVDTRLAGIIDNPTLVETLRAYIESDLSLQRTAEEIYVHPNTVAYRLRQISKLTGRDMRSTHDIADLHVALTAHDVLEMNKQTSLEDTDLRLVLAPNHDSPIDFLPLSKVEQAASSN